MTVLKQDRLPTQEPVLPENLSQFLSSVLNPCSAFLSKIPLYLSSVLSKFRAEKPASEPVFCGQIAKFVKKYPFTVILARYTKFPNSLRLDSPYRSCYRRLFRSSKSRCSFSASRDRRIIE